MKGIVFTALNDLVEAQFGMEMWESILDQVHPESGGIYTSVEDFSDDELFAMVAALSEKTEITQTDLLQVFGRYLFSVLISRHPVFVDNEPDYFEFLKSIDGVIHKEVNKLYTNPNLPKMDWQQDDPDLLILSYTSPRKLCYLAVGLIEGAAAYYDTEIEFDHGPCMHEGADACTFEIRRM